MSVATASEVQPLAELADARHVLVLVNPRAGRCPRRDAAGQLVSLLRSRGFDAQAVPDLADACGAAGELHAAGRLRALVAAGGDGTIAAAVNHTPPGMPIATLPLGTENLLARHFGISDDTAAVVETIVAGAARRFDVGRATSAAGSRLFLLMASAGLDAEIVRRLHERRSGHISHWSYIGPIVESLWRYRYPRLRLSRDGGPAEAARWAVAFNLPCYAGRLKFTDACDGADGRLDVCRFQRGGFWPTVFYYMCLVGGRCNWIPGRGVGQAASLRIESDEPAPFQLDGDPGGMLPVQLDVLPERLTLLAPTET